MAASLPEQLRSFRKQREWAIRTPPGAHSLALHQTGPMTVGGRDAARAAETPAGRLDSPCGPGTVSARTVAAHQPLAPEPQGAGHNKEA